MLVDFCFGRKPCGYCNHVRDSDSPGLVPLARIHLHFLACRDGVHDFVHSLQRSSNYQFTSD